MPRYIDADKLMERVNCKRYRKYHTCVGCDFFDEQDSWCSGELFGVQIMDAPAENVAPVVHAHWIDVDANDPFLLHGKCSHCGYEQWIRSDLRFCPNCGAKMDEKGKKEDDESDK